MKRISILFTLIIAMFTTIGAHAQNADEINILNILITEINKNCGSISKESDGYIDKMNVERVNRDIRINTTFKKGLINFADYTAAEQDEVADDLADNFISGFMEEVRGTDAEILVEILDEIGTRFLLYFYDNNGHCLTSTIEMSNLY